MGYHHVRSSASEGWGCQQQTAWVPTTGGTSCSSKYQRCDSPSYSKLRTGKREKSVTAVLAVSFPTSKGLLISY